MEKVRMEIEEKRKRQARKIMEAIEGGVMKKLTAKEEEIEKIGKLNWGLEERFKDERTPGVGLEEAAAAAADEVDDAQSCCDSNVKVERRICACVLFVGLAFIFAPFVNPPKMLGFM
ncbi:hypothetical protein REPUB_Repub05bG0087900 [Reevesia pubescens]